MKSLTLLGVVAVLLTRFNVEAEPLEASAPVANAYRLAANDVIDVKVYQEDDLETKARVSQDGTICFPLIGIVALGGRTIDEAGELIREKLQKDYLVNPQVTMMVSEYSKRRFTVLGQVQKPGSFEIPSEEAVTLLQAVAMAGGYTRLADRAHVKITRTAAGKIDTVTLDTKRESDAETTTFQIQADDTISVPERIF